MECQWFASFVAQYQGNFVSVFCLDGKCGICGEPHDAPVKLFEKGGAKYKGTIVKTYTQGQQIDVKVMVGPFRIHLEATAKDQFC